MIETLILIAKIINLIASGINAIVATIKIAEESGVQFNMLWGCLPGRWK